MANKTPDELNEAINANRAPCIEEDCYRPRHGMSKRCRQCLNNIQRTGDAAVRSDAYRRYAEYIPKVERLFRTFPDHPGYLAALTFVESWLDDAINLPEERESGYRNYVPGRKRMAQLAAADVPPALVLVHACSFFAWAWPKRKQGKYDTTGALELGVANAVARIIPVNMQRAEGKKPGGGQLAKSTLREIGRHIMGNLLPLLVRVNAGINQMEEEDKAQEAALKLPWNQEQLKANLRHVEVIKKQVESQARRKKIRS